MEESGGLHSIEWKRVRHTEVTEHTAQELQETLHTAPGFSHRTTHLATSALRLVQGPCQLLI